MPSRRGMTSGRITLNDDAVRSLKKKGKKNLPLKNTRELGQQTNAAPTETLQQYTRGALESQRWDLNAT